jgi:hypothetical protein
MTVGDVCRKGRVSELNIRLNKLKKRKECDTYQISVNICRAYIDSR